MVKYLQVLNLTLCALKKLTSWIAWKEIEMHGAPQQSNAHINHRKYVSASIQCRSILFP